MYRPALLRNSPRKFVTVVCSETNSATAIRNFYCITMLRSIIEGEFGQDLKMAAGVCIDDGLAQVLSLPFCLQSCRTPTRCSYLRNCSYQPLSRVELYNSSSSPAQRKALSYRLQYTTCVDFMGASVCPGTGQVALIESSSFVQAFGDFATSFITICCCQFYRIDRVSACLYTTFATPDWAMFVHGSSAARRAPKTKSFAGHCARGC
jgi:hypothetical protein